MRLGAVTPVFNEQALIKGCVKSLEGFVDKHVICVSERPYFGGEVQADKTAEIAEDLGADVFRGYWSLDHHQRNTGIALLSDMDWIICTDVDMWFEKHQVEALIKKLETAQSDAFIIRQKSYWRDIDHTLVNDEFKPVIAIRPHVKFIYIGNIDSHFEVIDDIYVHHLNWCAPKDIYKKVTTYSHAPEFNGKGWYKNFENWKEGEKAVLPTGLFEVEYDPLPAELRAYL